MFLSVFPCASRLVCVFGSEFITLLLLFHLCWFWTILTSLLALLYSHLPLNHCCESWTEKRSLIFARCLPCWQSSLGLFLWDALSLSLQLELTALKWSSHGPMPCLHQSEWTMEEHQLPHPPVTSLWQPPVWTLVLCFTAMAGEAMSTFCILENHQSTNLKSSHPQTHEGIASLPICASFRQLLPAERRGLREGLLCVFLFSCVQQATAADWESHRWRPVTAVGGVGSCEEAKRQICCPLSLSLHMN